MINLHAHKLDFEWNDGLFKEGNIDLVINEVTICAALYLRYHKVAKFITKEVTLSNEEIIVISPLIKEVVLAKLEEEKAKNIFLK